MKFARLLLLLAAVLFTVQSFRIMVREADSLPAFVSDELNNVQQATHFLSGDQYFTDCCRGYDLSFSSGIATTWPAALGWFAGHRLIYARIADAFCAWLFAMLLGIYFFRSRGFDAMASLAAPSALWAATITSPFALPYWHGFLLSLGELNGALWLAAGLMLLGSWPMLASFLFGLAVWHGKLLYGSYAAAALLAWVIARRPGLQKVLLVGAMFVAPLVLFVSYLFLRFGSSGAGAFLSAQFRWFLDMKNSSTPMPGAVTAAAAEEPVRGLFARLASPRLEWSHLSGGVHAKIAVLSLLPFLGGALAAAQAKSRPVFWTTLGLLGALAVHDAWWFLLHKEMWIRHLQPALYVGLGLWIFWLTGIAQRWARLRVAWLAAAFALVAAQAYVAWRGPLFGEGVRYAWACNELSSPQCIPK
jgi:hypothetical protein